MAALNYPVVGPPKPDTQDGSVPIRREVRDLQQNYPDQWNLFLIGLTAFMQKEPTTDLSYYGIAGIHGRPYRSWGGSGPNNPTGWQGYCTHSSILFAPWHRPYLALYEQVLYETINEIASTFPDDSRDQYQQAASNFRIPYWDWAADPPSGSSYFPSLLNSTTVSVITPDSNGQSVRIRNPLYSYTFNPLNPFGNDFATLRGTPYDRWQTTLRYPTSTTSVNAQSQPRMVQQAAASQLPNIQGDVNILLSDPSYKNLAAFSSNEWHQPTRGSQTSDLGSVEDVHGSIHVLIGGPMGHFSQLQYSAFDPVFWLHHANVDRLFAIWQAINPQAYAINKVENDGTFSITGGSVVTQDTPLAPFNDTSGNKYWTSTGVRQTETFNYAYPETQRWNFGSDSDYINSVADAVDQLYGGVSQRFRGGFNVRSTTSNAPVADRGVETTGAATGTASKPVDQHRSGIIHAIGHKIKEAVSGHHDKDKVQPKDGTRDLDFESEIGKHGTTPQPQETSYTEYVCTLKGPKHILEQTYVVHVFLGDFESDTATWGTQDALVGTFAVFGKALTTGCEKCVRDAEDQLEVSGTVTLTAQLITEVEAGRLGSLDRVNVLPWLKKNLHWRVTLADGTEKERAEVPHLKVGVMSTVVVLPVGQRAQFSGDWEIHTEVTEGRPAGLNPPATGATGPV